MPSRRAVSPERDDRVIAPQPRASTVSLPIDPGLRRRRMRRVVLGGRARRMTLRWALLLSTSLLLVSGMQAGAESPAEDRDSPPDRSGRLSRVNHIIVVMQENHSFDNYFG